MIVVDASIIATLYREEPHSDAASDLVRRNSGMMAAPDLLGIEVAAVLVRDGNTDPGLKALQRDKLAHLNALLDSEAIRLVRSDPGAIARAGHLALAVGTAIKDCIYLVLARDLDCPLVTSDARFAAKARDWGTVRLLGG